MVDRSSKLLCMTSSIASSQGRAYCLNVDVLQHYDASYWDTEIALAVTRWNHLFFQQQESIAAGIGVEKMRVRGIIRDNKLVYFRPSLSIGPHFSSLHGTGEPEVRSRRPGNGLLAIAIVEFGVSAAEKVQSRGSAPRWQLLKLSHCCSPTR
jgi:hypothetical protein